MTILFVAGLPRSSSLGVADLLYRCINSDSRALAMTGHLHLAAGLSGVDLNNYHSPLHLYDAREALIRCLLSLNQIPLSLDSYESISNYFFSSDYSRLDIDRFKSMLADINPIIIDPSFSHAIDSRLLDALPDLGIELNLLVIWRHPIDFGLDLMQGVYGFDVCLQWILANPSLSLPLDPLMLWLAFVKPFIELINHPPSIYSRLIHIQREILSPHTLSIMCRSLSTGYNPSLRPSVVTNTTPLLRECPFSGDPSYIIQTSRSPSLEISRRDLSRFSNHDQLVQEVLDAAQTIGYCVND